MNEKLEKMAAALEASNDYRILRRIRPRRVVKRPLNSDERLAIILDTETTGLMYGRDEVIELGMLAVTYDESGSLGDVVGEFESLNEPRQGITSQITKITGISDEMVRGHRISVTDVAKFVQPANLIIAHNAAFDRPFCEGLSPLFATKPWACSAREIDWQEFGYEGTKLGYLLTKAGLFHSGHRALSDCQALLEILDISAQGKRPFSVLLESARKTQFMLKVKVPYSNRSIVREKNYRWNPESRNGASYWWKLFNEEELEEEKARLENAIGRNNFESKIEKITAFNRFKQN